MFDVKCQIQNVPESWRQRRQCTSFPGVRVRVPCLKSWAFFRQTYQKSTAHFAGLYHGNRIGQYTGHFTVQYPIPDTWKLIFPWTHVSINSNTIICSITKFLFSLSSAGIEVIIAIWSKGKIHVSKRWGPWISTSWKMSFSHGSWYILEKRHSTKLWYTIVRSVCDCFYFQVYYYHQ